MIDLSSCTEKELWEYVAVELSKQGLKNVLVGGAVAAIYSEGIYKSGDLDFVIESYVNTKPKIEAAMKTIGFENYCQKTKNVLKWSKMAATFENSKTSPSACRHNQF